MIEIPDTDLNEKKTQRNKKCWSRAFQLGKEYGIDFSLNARMWAYDRLKTVVGWEEREIKYYKSEYTIEQIDRIIERKSKFYSFII